MGETPAILHCATKTFH